MFLYSFAKAQVPTTILSHNKRVGTFLFPIHLDSDVQSRRSMYNRIIIFVIKSIKHSNLIPSDQKTVAEFLVFLADIFPQSL